MKRVLLGVAILGSAVAAVHANKHHLPQTLETRFHLLQKRIKFLVPCGLENTFKVMNYKNEETKRDHKIVVKNINTDYVVCYKKEGNKFFGTVNPKVEYRKDVTDEGFAPIVKQFFDVTKNKKGVGHLSYVYQDVKKEARIVDLHHIKKDIPAQTYVCAVVAGK